MVARHRMWYIVIMPHYLMLLFVYLNQTTVGISLWSCFIWLGKSDPDLWPAPKIINQGHGLGVERNMPTSMYNVYLNQAEGNKDVSNEIYS